MSLRLLPWLLVSPCCGCGSKVDGVDGDGHASSMTDGDDQNCEGVDG